ncbi:hypothetical protein Sta7437_3460 [Stanieria cyanosphaera PCC 7437]|uniref:DUF3616 domain-containing protein n=1 Tax=Stanieria cyanosphaera (strain ATCC 29371 / PCC 7437) TaxID=111780 RepID=K9XXY1_STAC7|nr:DUF3616 domain-containing protein [Stanieria cyanosphaera]AFZ36961.1 hypothetical protein Sta7437_3460 [Stanieria cyanosphaera PCC 7437]
MKKILGSLILFCFSLIFGLSSNFFNPTLAEELGTYPLCEPSALIEINCPNQDGNCLLVGDNEIDDSVFVYPINAEKFNSESQQILAFDHFKIKDLEAIAFLDNHQLILFGSHSRNTKCSVKKSRKRFVVAEIVGDRLKRIKQVEANFPINSHQLFTEATINQNQIIQAVSQAIDRAEQAADLAEGNFEQCQQINSFNFEGAVTVPNTNNVWLGLRSPLVNYQGKNWTILLHLTNLNQFQFDSVALLDLQGRGIRDLTFKNNFIWGIAGGPEDDLDNFFLWQFPVKSLQANAMIEPKTIQSLPSFAEGLAIVNDQAYLVIDGDLGDSNSQCQISGKYQIINLKKN